MTEAFKQALSDFSFDAAAGRAIRHLCDLGMDADEIAEKLDYPVPINRIKREMNIYEEERKAVAEGKAEEYTIIKENSKFGKTYFRRVKRET